MSATIGGQPVICLDGAVPLVGMETVKKRRPALNGSDIKALGNHGQPATIRVWLDFDSAAARRTMYRLFYQAQGSVVTIVDHDGEAYPNIHIVTVSPLERFTALTAEGGLTDGRYVLGLALEIENVSSIP